MDISNKYPSEHRLTAANGGDVWVFMYPRCDLGYRAVEQVGNLRVIQRPKPQGNDRQI